MSAFRSTVVLVALVPLVACEGEIPPLATLEPCEHEHACEVAGVDLGILSVTPLWTPDQPLDESLDLHVVQPGDTVVADVVIINRGDAAATESATLRALVRDGHHELRAETVVAPLGVAGRDTVRLSFSVQEGVRFSGPFGSDPSVTLVSDAEDADSANDVADGFEFRAAAPLLEFRVDGLPDTMRTGRPYAVSLVVTNLSDVAFDGGLEMSYCASEIFEHGCAIDGMQTFSGFTLGAVPANATVTIPDTLEIPIESVWWFDSYSRAEIAPCVLTRGDWYRCIFPPDLDTEQMDDTTILPDLIGSCPAATPLVDGTIWDVTTGFCEHNVMAPEFPRTYAVGWFESEEGACWRMQQDLVSEPQVTLRREDLENTTTRDVVADCRRVDVAGEYLLIVDAHSAEGPSGTIELTRIY